MCELLGMSFNQPVRPNISFKGFQRRGKRNPDGWGIAFYPDNAAQIFKEPLKATESALANFIKDYSEIKSKLFIAHVRRGSSCGLCYKNTHPFSRELNGKEYIFAHNGTLKNFEKLPSGRFHKIGCTDSEHAFCYILSCIEEKSITHWNDERFEWLGEKLKKINELGTFNCIFSDGEYLFCYHDKTEYNGLWFVHRKAPYGKIQLLDEDFEINLAEEKDPTQKGFVIATKPLTNEKWEKFNPCELIVFKNGEIVFPNYRKYEKSSHISLYQKELNILKILRQNPHRMSLKEICQNLSLPKEEIIETIRSLKCKELIKQDSRDKVKWDNDDATYYTNPSKRKEIDELIGK